ncbi:MAG: SDR family oxidoreductase [Tenericutes bacterium]|nr:SDR family oxidoreductase [Mycoplasmatota bacterium]
MNNKVMLVTGSSIGLGNNIIYEAAKSGYDVIINYLTHEKEAFELKNKVEKEFKIKTLCIKCDITKEEDIKNMVNKIVNTYGKIDVLVNNASISKDNEFNLKTKEDFVKVLEVNTIGTFLISRAIGNVMLNQKQGKIINISSNNAIDSYYEYSLDYDASKAAVINLTHNLASHYAPYINVNCICPGWINTSINNEISEEFKKKELNKILLRRFAEPKEITDLVLFLASEKSNYINDSVIKIDGGIKC